MQRLTLILLLATIMLSPVQAREVIYCTGTLIDIDIRPRAPWPYAAVYDAKARRTCVIDRLDAGHDPFRGTCDVGSLCTVWGGWQRKIRATYYLDPHGWHSTREQSGSD